MNSKVDWYFTKAKKWKEEFEQLRTIILDCGLTEELKWGHPCYTHSTGPDKSSGRAFENKNIVLIHGFKEYCAGGAADPVHRCAANCPDEKDPDKVHL
jgi:uncharacterized protein YdeI (YjbR/CyaY-like superfamily)